MMNELSLMTIHVSLMINELSLKKIHLSLMTNIPSHLSLMTIHLSLMINDLSLMTNSAFLQERHSMIKLASQLR